MSTPIPRLLAKPASTFFLVGPRGTGKSTWLLAQFPHARRVDLLKASEYLRYKRDPSALQAEAAALERGSWIILDEVPKLPELLDEVHASLFDLEEKVRFALCGSSARKLKRSGANLLAGRAVTRQFFPLTSVELGEKFDLDRALRFGLLPRIVRLGSDEERTDYLYSYVETYLTEEIRQEAAVRNLDAFHRFLEVVALANSQVLNLSNISRDVGVARSTVQGYFEILTDTLLGWYLPAFRPRAKVKEVEHPKFYFFDCGVARSLTQALGTHPTQAEMGFLFEMFFLNEVRALTSYRRAKGRLSYWRTPWGNEVDLIWTHNRSSLGFEIKYSPRWKTEFNLGLETLFREKKIRRGLGIYTGKTKLRYGEIVVWPYRMALDRIATGELAPG